MEMLGLNLAPRLAQPVRPPVGAKNMLLLCRLLCLQLKVSEVSSLQSVNSLFILKTVQRSNSLFCLGIKYSMELMS